MVADDTDALGPIQKRGEFRRHSARDVWNLSGSEHATFDILRRTKLGLVGDRARLDLDAPMYCAQAGELAHQQSQRSPARHVRTGIQDQHSLLQPDVPGLLEIFFRVRSECCKCLRDRKSTRLNSS